MEHRLDNRRPVSIAGRLYLGDEGVSCRITELSQGGLRVRSPVASHTRLFEVIAIEFTDAKDDETHLLRGMVVHAEGNELGLMFIHVSHDALNRLSLAA